MYRKLETSCKLSNELRSDIKFEIDISNKLVFTMYSDFETLSSESIVGDEWEALDTGTAIICKPIYDDQNGYFELIRSRVKLGAIGRFVAGGHKIAEFKIIEVINQI